LQWAVFDYPVAQFQKIQDFVMLARETRRWGEAGKTRRPWFSPAWIPVCWAKTQAASAMDKDRQRSPEKMRFSVFGFGFRLKKQIVSRLRFIFQKFEVGRASAPATQGGQGRPPHRQSLASYRQESSNKFGYVFLGRDTR
jgi:hypothetical protein